MVLWGLLGREGVSGQMQLVLVIVTAVTCAVSPVLQPVLGVHPLRALLAVGRLWCLPAFCPQVGWVL
jgi:hypothetical protein